MPLRFSPSRHSLRLRPASGQGEWREAVHGLRGVTPFHAWEWLDWVAPLVACRFHPLVITSGDGELLGVAPMLVHRRAGVGTANWVPFPYLGPIVSPVDIPATLVALRSWCLRRGIVDVQVSEHPTRSQEGEFGEACRSTGFAVATDDTYIHSLEGRSVADLERSLARQRRSQIHQCLQQGMQVREATPSEVGRLLPEIHATDVARHGLESAYSEDLGDRVAWGAPKMPMRLAAACLADGEVAGVMATLGGDISACWMGGGLDRFRDLNVTALLYWDAMCWALDAGSRWIDLVGNPSPGIATFKKRFGGELATYSVGHRSSFGYDRLRRWDSERRSKSSS